MKICNECGQIVAEKVDRCPACGTEVAAGRTTIDDFHILELLHEGYASILCKARRHGESAPVMIRIFTPNSGVDAHLAERLKHELEELQALPETYFVRHLAIRQSIDGLWYRISEWVEALNWGTLLSTGRLTEVATALQLFGQIASILDGLHRIGHIIPHLILDDILIYEDSTGALRAKIDYKLSRFLDPQLDRPAPMLARLLAMHPDIVNHRPLDRRSDIWSLGKVFVEILSADPGVTDLLRQVDALPVPAEIRTLIRLMLSENPEMRPQTMADVADTLRRIDRQAVRAAVRQHAQQARPTQALLLRLNLRLGLVAFVLAVAIAAGVVFWYRLNTLPQDSESVLMGFANQYAGSVAFVVVDYWLQLGEKKVYRNRAEGTAFLADEQGHLLTNRHVACPWLEDRRLLALIGFLGQRPEKLNFDYRMYLWFDGQRAFSRLPALADSEMVEDMYMTASAFSSQGPRQIRIAGVAPAPVRTRERVRSPLRDDFAVLEIDDIPAGLQPLPLATGFSAADMPKLTPLITLGFPLGSRTQAETVNVSVTSGHVRRSFDTMLQVDTSLHPGNSGGPFIDTRGRVVGMATIVAVAVSKAPVPVATPLSDIGLVLPITKAAAFLEEIRAGKIKWNGEIDVALEQRLQEITEAARRYDWQQACELADRFLEQRRTPSLVMAAAVMHLCAGDYSDARRLFEQALSMEPERNMARLMVLMADWLDGRELNRAYRQFLTALDWRSPDEFLGYLTTLLAGDGHVHQAIGGGYSSAENSWLNLIAGLMEDRQGNRDAAWPLLENAALSADTDDWSLYLALAQLDRIHHCQTAQPSDRGTLEAFKTRRKTFDARLAQAIEGKADLRKETAPIKSAIVNSEVSLETQRSLLKKLHDRDLGNGYLLIAQAYYAAIDDDWDAALDFSRQFLARPGRINAGKLSVGLLEPEILNIQGHNAQARSSLENFRDRIADPWYRRLSDCLLDPQRQVEITAEAGESPEKLLTGHTALGLWAEGSGDGAGAIRHYREALTSYMDHRIEYDFALGRMKRLRQAGE